MMLSDARQSFWIHLVVDSLEAAGFVTYEDKEKAIQAARVTMNQCLRECKEIDMKVKEKISSLKKQVVEGGSEWDTLYYNYLEDEMVRRGLVALKKRTLHSH